ncbi:uncharacterized protein LOC34619478 [Cyclospora cayetanensis]|uniref:Uncharacterized protein LOC34619478 n=1 Tax=Cyclospora cayetanensis TaxID=88456 RepID=A0A6P6RSM7_9EIME|nr:uncharacterized protein LOC34619478 [Cyclospora cayetanensis]
MSSEELDEGTAAPTTGTESRHPVSQASEIEHAQQQQHQHQLPLQKLVGNIPVSTQLIQSPLLLQAAAILLAAQQQPQQQQALQQQQLEQQAATPFFASEEVRKNEWRTSNSSSAGRLTSNCSSTSSKSDLLRLPTSHTSPPSSIEAPPTQEQPQLLDEDHAAATKFSSRGCELNSVADIDSPGKKQPQLGVLDSGRQDSRGHMELLLLQQQMEQRKTGWLQSPMSLAERAADVREIAVYLQHQGGQNHNRDASELQHDVKLDELPLKGIDDFEEAIERQQQMLHEEQNQQTHGLQQCCCCLRSFAGSRIEKHMKICEAAKRQEQAKQQRQRLKQQQQEQLEEQRRQQEQILKRMQAERQREQQQQLLLKQKAVKQRRDAAAARAAAAARCVAARSSSVGEGNTRKHSDESSGSSTSSRSSRNNFGSQLDAASASVGAAEKDKFSEGSCMNQGSNNMGPSQKTFQIDSEDSCAAAKRAPDHSTQSKTGDRATATPSVGCSSASDGACDGAEANTEEAQESTRGEAAEASAEAVAKENAGINCLHSSPGDPPPLQQRSWSNSSSRSCSRATSGRLTSKRSVSSDSLKEQKQEDSQEQQCGESQEPPQQASQEKQQQQHVLPKKAPACGRTVLQRAKPQDRWRLMPTKRCPLCSRRFCLKSIERHIEVCRQRQKEVGLRPPAPVPGSLVILPAAPLLQQQQQHSQQASKPSVGRYAGRGHGVGASALAHSRSISSEGSKLAAAQSTVFDCALPPQRQHRQALPNQRRDISGTTGAISARGYLRDQSVGCVKSDSNAETSSSSWETEVVEGLAEELRQLGIGDERLAAVASRFASRLRQQHRQELKLQAELESFKEPSLTELLPDVFAAAAAAARRIVAAKLSREHRGQHQQQQKPAEKYQQAPEIGCGITVCEAENRASPGSDHNRCCNLKILGHSDSPLAPPLKLPDSAARCHSSNNRTTAKLTPRSPRVEIASPGGATTAEAVTKRLSAKRPSCIKGRCGRCGGIARDSAVQQQQQEVHTVKVPLKITTEASKAYPAAVSHSNGTTAGQLAAQGATFSSHQYELHRHEQPLSSAPSRSVSAAEDFCPPQRQQLKLAETQRFQLLQQFQQQQLQPQPAQQQCQSKFYGSQQQPQQRTTLLRRQRSFSSREASISRCLSVDMPVSQQQQEETLQLHHLTAQQLMQERSERLVSAEQTARQLEAIREKQIQQHHSIKQEHLMQSSTTTPAANAYQEVCLENLPHQQHVTVQPRQPLSPLRPIPQQRVQQSYQLQQQPYTTLQPLQRHQPRAMHSRSLVLDERQPVQKTNSLSTDCYGYTTRAAKTGAPATTSNSMSIPSSAVLNSYFRAKAAIGTAADRQIPYAHGKCFSVSTTAADIDSGNNRETLRSKLTQRAFPVQQSFAAADGAAAMRRLIEALCFHRSKQPSIRRLDRE